MCGVYSRDGNASANASRELRRCVCAGSSAAPAGLLLMGGALAESLHLVLRRAGPLPRRPEMKTRLGGSGQSDGDGGEGLKGRGKRSGQHAPEVQAVPRLHVWQAKPLSAGEPGDNTLMDFNKTPLPHNALYQIKEPRIYMPETVSH